MTAIVRPRARPRFAYHHALAPDPIAARIRRQLEVPGGPVRGKVFARTALLTLVEERRHFWTPHLDLQLGEARGGGTDLTGTFAPHPQLWATFVATQLLFAVLSLGLGIYVLNLWSLGQDATVAAILLAGALIGGGLSYGTAYIGQGLGSEQMYELRSFLDAALREDG